MPMLLPIVTTLATGYAVYLTVQAQKEQKKAIKESKEAREAAAARSQKVQEQIAGDKEKGIASAPERAEEKAKETATTLKRRETKTILTSPTEAQPDVAKKALKRRKAKTILTSPLGAEQPVTAKKTLLGQ